MINDLRVSLFDMSMCLSNAMDLISPMVVDHHKQVSYIASSIAEEMGLPEEDRVDLIMAGLLHDIGAISLRERIDALAFEADGLMSHASIGYCLIKSFSLLEGIAPIVRFHHIPWDKGAGSEHKGEPVPMLGHVLHLADRVSVLIRPDEEILGQVGGICERIERKSDVNFHPEAVDAFMDLSKKEYFWFDSVSGTIGRILKQRMRRNAVDLGLGDVLSLSRLFSRIIDFRSRFTATHSSGVSATAGELARMSGMSDTEVTMMKTAGYLHDLGKIAVPSEILEKPGALTEAEQNIMKTHTYYTYRIIETISGLDTINEWASFHHECISGNGYPFRRKGEELSPGSRIMAVADVFTALSEDRPYRPGMSRNSTVRVLRQFADDSSLDGGIVSLVIDNFDTINHVRANAQMAESDDYRQYREAKECRR